MSGKTRRAEKKDLQSFTAVPAETPPSSAWYCHSGELLRRFHDLIQHGQSSTSGVRYHTTQARTKQRTHNNSRLPRVERNFDRDDKLRNDRQDFAAAMLEHVKSSLDCKETVRLLLFAQAVKKDGKVVVIIQLFDVYLPLDPAPSN